MYIRWYIYKYLNLMHVKFYNKLIITYLNIKYAFIYTICLGRTFGARPWPHILEFNIFTWTDLVSNIWIYTVAVYLTSVLCVLYTYNKMYDAFGVIQCTMNNVFAFLNFNSHRYGSISRIACLSTERIMI